MRALLAALMLCSWGAPLVAGDFGRLAQSTGPANPGMKDWYSRQMQPDAWLTSCCGPGDVYWADKFEIGADGQFYAIVTDDRPDEILDAEGNIIAVRPHVDVGTRVLIPPIKHKDPRADPMPEPRHGVVWLRTFPDKWVYCYVSPPGDL